MNNEQLIKHYLETNKVTPFWAASAMAWIGRVMAGNRFFVQEVSNPKLRTRNGHVTRFECEAIANVPDSGKTVKARILYTFKPGKAKAHHVELITA